MFQSINTIKILMFLFVLSQISRVSGQNELDAKRMVSTGLAGTARVQAMGGAFSAAGGDFTSSLLNPAGLALYKRSDFMLTTGLRFVKHNSLYLGQNDDALKTRAGITNLGLVIHGGYRPYESRETRQDKTPKLTSYAFSVGFNQLENYHRQTQAYGYNSQNSFSSFLASRAQGTLPSQITPGSLADMGYYVWLIDPKSGDSANYNAAAPNRVNQSISRNETGRLNEWNFGLSGNFEDLLYLGMTVGFRNLEYSSTYNFEEADPGQIHNSWGAYNSSTADSVGFNTMTYTDEFRTSGTGFNLGLGVIVRPSDFARLGLSIQTPTWYALSDRYSSSLVNRSDQNEVYAFNSELGQFNYNLATPYKITGGVSFILAKALLLNGDVDVLDYRNTRFSSIVYGFRTENNAIRNVFDRAYNFRLGAEYKYGPIYLRGGYAWFDPVMNELGNSYSDITTNGTVKINAGRQNLTGGIGYREDAFYVDLGVIRSRTQDKYSVYAANNLTGFSPVLVNKINVLAYVVTMGLRF
jgi:hypothetical protein